MRDEHEIHYDVRDRIATITLNRPERLNAYTPRMGESLEAAVAAAAADSEVRVIVVTGAGRGFCAGADMADLSGRASGSHVDVAMKTKTDSNVGAQTFGPDLMPHFRESQRFTYFVRSRKPVIAAINGPAAGLGLVLALYADFRFASDKAVFTTSFAQRGLIAELGISWLLPRLVGQANALDLLFSARKIGASEAEKIGLVNKVYEADGFMDSVRAYAKILVETSSPRSMAIMKAQIWKANFQDYNEAMDIADREMALSLAHDEFREGVSHFLEKRPPRFADI
jgi:enoyl-CoA hydratase/carnithine racemase